MWTVRTCSKGPTLNVDPIIVKRISGGYFVGVFFGFEPLDEVRNTAADLFEKQAHELHEYSAKGRLRVLFTSIAEKLKGCHSGTMATVACLWNSGRVTFAILGDSMVVGHTRHKWVQGPFHPLDAHCMIGCKNLKPPPSAIPLIREWNWCNVVVLTTRGVLNPALEQAYPEDLSILKSLVNQYESAKGIVDRFRAKENKGAVVLCHHTK